MNFYCCEERRRNAMRAQNIVNGIDYLEVLDEPGQPEAERQHVLNIFFFGSITESLLTKHNILIEGGERIRDISVQTLEIGKYATINPNDPGKIEYTPDPKAMVVRVEQTGDFSTYTLRLIRNSLDKQSPESFDPVTSSVDFSFKVQCPSIFDCLPSTVCQLAQLKEPEINYLAKDYASFRRLLLDRLSVIMPDWQERSAADLGVTLVEALAYVGDYLSYRQDAVATEAYLDTARKRISVRRHARLLDYRMHEGCNARTWVQIQVDADDVTIDKGTQLLTKVPDVPDVFPTNSSNYERAIGAGPVVFETLHETKLFKNQNEMHFYTWGDERCCLPKGATSATLRGHYPHLKPKNQIPPIEVGDILVFIENRAPDTGRREDADIKNRHAVRLIKVERKEDPLGGSFTEPPTSASQPVTDIYWHKEDALPAPVCISTRIGESNEGKYYDDMTVVFGNIVAADHGLTITEEIDEPVPNAELFVVLQDDNEPCDAQQRQALTPHYRLQLKEAPLTFFAPYDEKKSASAAKKWDLRETKSAAHVNLLGDTTSDADPWESVSDLLGSGPDSEEFVIEMDNDGIASLRFGDDQFGKRPIPGSEFTATYRVGNGTKGNIGANTLKHIVTSKNDIIKVSNPLAAWGGVEQESISDVKRKAPFAYRVQQRAVTKDDYATVTERHPEVQKARARISWTGSWHTVFITVDRLGGLQVDSEFETELSNFLEKYRMAGIDIEIEPPIFVSLDIGLTIHVAPDFYKGNVKAALLEIFSNRNLSEGRRGFFHPDNFTFNQPVYLSQIIATAMQVPGVEWVDSDDSLNRIILFKKPSIGSLIDMGNFGISRFVIPPSLNRFKRFRKPAAGELAAGRIDMGNLEIARLDNDPNAPENGIIEFFMRGGL